MADTDYRELLKKYMEHVLYAEGTDFINPYCPSYFSEEEWDILQQLSKEANG